MSWPDMLVAVLGALRPVAVRFGLAVIVVLLLVLVDVLPGLADALRDRLCESSSNTQGSTVLVQPLSPWD